MKMQDIWTVPWNTRHMTSVKYTHSLVSSLTTNPRGQWDHTTGWQGEDAGLGGGQQVLEEAASSGGGQQVWGVGSRSWRRQQVQGWATGLGEAAGLGVDSRSGGGSRFGGRQQVLGEAAPLCQR